MKSDIMTMAEKYAAVKVQGVVEFYRMNVAARELFTKKMTESEPDAREWLINLFLEIDKRENANETTCRHKK